MTNPNTEDELDKMFKVYPMGKEPPDGMEQNIHGTWTGLWLDAYGEYDEKQVSDVWAIEDMLSDERLEWLRGKLLAWRDKAVLEARIDAQIGITEYYDQASDNDKVNWKGLFADSLKQLRYEQATLKESKGDSDGTD